VVSRIYQIHQAAPAVLERGGGIATVVNRSVSQKAKFRGTNRPVSWICCIDLYGME